VSHYIYETLFKTKQVDTGRQDERDQGQVSKSLGQPFSDVVTHIVTSVGQILDCNVVEIGQGLSLVFGQPGQG
jgi:hypothetical protein